MLQLLNLINLLLQKSRHHNAGVENARAASMESHTLTTQERRVARTQVFLCYILNVSFR